MSLRSGIKLKVFTAEELKDSSFPQVVRICADPGTPLNFGPLVSTDKPFVIHSHRKRTKVRADNLLWDSRKEEYVSTEKEIEIPKDYPGWFELLSPDGRTTKYHATLSSILSTGCRKFLIRSSVIGYICRSHDKEIELGKEVKIKAGEVLSIVDICSKKWRTYSDGKERDLNKPTAETKYLKCMDPNKQEICIPLAHPGKFSPLADKEGKISNAAYSIGQILKIFKLPVKVRLLFGMAPLENFTTEGVFRLTKITKKDTFVMQCVHPHRQIFLELPFDANVRFDPEQESKTESHIYETLPFTSDELYFYYLVSIKECDTNYSKKDSIKTDHQYYTFGLMANPIDMANFKVPRLFPAAKEDVPSENWPITFRDPDLDERDDSSSLSLSLERKLKINSVLSRSISEDHHKKVHNTIRTQREAKC